MTNLTDEQYAVITDKMAECNTEREFDAFEQNVLAKVDPKDPLMQSLMNAYGMIRTIKLDAR